MKRMCMYQYLYAIVNDNKSLKCKDCPQKNECPDKTNTEPEEMEQKNDREIL